MQCEDGGMEEQDTEVAKQGKVSLIMAAQLEERDRIYSSAAASLDSSLSAGLSGGHNITISND